jgi:hypothetical protein
VRIANSLLPSPNSYLYTMEPADAIANWKKIKEALLPTFGEDLDMQAVLFIIGMQELGHGPTKLTKEQKVDVMHIAICTLLEPMGYYLYKGRDEDNWPHWENTGKMPHMTATEQNRFMIERMIEYFKRKGLIG